MRAWPQDSHDAPDQESHPQDDIYKGRHPVFCWVVGQNNSPVDTGDSRTDYEREGRAERDSTEDAETPESHEGANACPSPQGSDGEQRRGDVEAGQPQGERSEQEFCHPPMVPSSQNVSPLDSEMTCYIGLMKIGKILGDNPQGGCTLVFTSVY